MGTIVSLLFRFILAAFFKRGELDVTRSTFRPVKVLAVFVLVIYLVSVTYSSYKMYHIYDKIEKICPGIIGGVKDFELHVLEVGHYDCAPKKP